MIVSYLPKFALFSVGERHHAGFGLSKLLAIVLAGSLLVACNNLSPAAAQRPTPAESPVGTEVPIEESQAIAPDEPGPTPTLSGLDQAIDELLAAADSALQVNQLTTPAEDNAFDRYRAVLLLRPNQPQALEGLRQIGDRYIALAQSALSGGDLARARALLDRAREVDADANAVAGLDNEITRRQREQPAPVRAPKVANDKEIVLDPRALSRKDESLQQFLKDLARNISKTEESLVITARNDAEGRWIYKLLNETVPEHRVRGDIRLGREPKIVLLPPIE